MNRPFAYGDKVLLLDNKQRRYLITLAEGAEFHTHAGFIPHAEFIDKPEGIVMRSTRNAAYTALRPTLEDFVLEMPRGAQVIYEAADPFSRKLILDRGTLQGLQSGSPVMDENGIVGQITRAYPMVSELTLITDPDHAIPVLNVRNGLRGVAYGDSDGSDMIELRYMATNADIQEGDLLTTSGIDGVFPPGLPVARVIKIERRSESIFARILCQPIALTQGVRHVMVISTLGANQPDRPAPDEVKPAKKGARK